MNRISCFSLLTAFFFGALDVSAAELSREPIDQQTDAILAKIPVEHRVELLAGIRNFSTRGWLEAGLPEYLMSDGPLGVRAERVEYNKTSNRTNGRSTAFPADILLAASWDPTLAKAEGEALGREARSHGIHILLGPAVNIYRLPVGGRNFEYMGEDPYLASRICVQYIDGVQSQQVAACVKHFACNNQERHRFEYNAIVDERALHEIYFPAFEAAIHDGHVMTIMSSYNQLNGTYAASNRMLLTDVLRNQWKFEGLCMSDWGSIHETPRTINDGVDLEMPSPKFLAADKLRPLLAEGKVSETTIDEKLRRIIRLGVEMGWNNRPQFEAMSQADDDAHDQLALKIARAGITLLKNDNQVLPLDRTKIKTLAILGPSADAYISGDGSSRINAMRPRTILDGLKQVAGNSVKIIRIPAASTDVEQLAASSTYEHTGNARPLQVEYFNNDKLEGAPVATIDDDIIRANWKRNKPIPQITGDRFSIRWRGTIKAPTSGNYSFATKSDDGSRVFLDGTCIVDNWRDQQSHVERGEAELKAGETHKLVVEYFNSAEDAEIAFGWGPAADAISAEQMAAIKSADAVICCVHTLDSEGDDRPYNLPLDQEKMLEEVAGLNAKTIVVLNSGGNIAMAKWIDRVPALLDGFFSGQAGGIATAEILFGDVNPSGHLPATFEKTWDDAFAHTDYPGDAKNNVKYAEGIYVGYRYFDTRKIEPRFAFGTGLSYTTFKISDLQATAGEEESFEVTANVTNTGPRAGATVAQLYIRPKAVEDRPFQELKAFARVELRPNETKPATMKLDRRSFAIWDVNKHDWVVPAGEYELAVGRSSREIDEIAKVTIR